MTTSITVLTPLCPCPLCGVKAISTRRAIWRKIVRDGAD